MSANAHPYQQLDAWIDAHFDDEVAFMRELVRVPPATPPGDTADWPPAP